MDVQAMRDELAKVMGWTYQQSVYRMNPGTYWCRNGRAHECRHPIDGTLDQLAKLWPEGWIWTVAADEWFACVSFDVDVIREPGVTSVSVRRTKDEYADRLALTLAAHKAASVLRGGGR